MYKELLQIKVSGTAGCCASKLMPAWKAEEIGFKAHFILQFILTFKCVKGGFL